MKLKYVYALLLSTLIYSCDDSTSGIGNSIIAAGDSIPAGAATYDVKTQSILADSVYARTITAYLGKYTDPQFGEFTADFIAQFNCTDNYEFPETIQEITLVIPDDEEDDEPIADDAEADAVPPAEADAVEE